MNISHGYLQLVIQIISVFLATAFVLWGLKIYRFIITINGVIIGGCAGIALGLSIGGETGVIILLGLFLAALGGLLAWFLAKLFFSISVGLYSALLGVVLFALAGVEVDTWPVIGIIFFLGGAITAFLLFDYLVIIGMAYQGGYIIFNSLFLRKFLHYNSGYSYQEDFFEILIKCLTQNIIAFLVIIIVFIFFALYFQKRQSIRSEDSPQKAADKQCFRNTTYLFALISLISYSVQLALFTVYQNSHPGHYGFSGMMKYLIIFMNTNLIIGGSIITWPIVALFAYFLVKSFDNLWDNTAGIFPAVQLIFAALFGLIINPIVTSFILFIVLLLQHVHFDLGFYTSFYEAHWSFIVVKGLYSFVLFPYLFYTFAIKKPSMQLATIPPVQITEGEQKVPATSEQTTERKESSKPYAEQRIEKLISYTQKAYEDLYEGRITEQNWKQVTDQWRDEIAELQRKINTPDKHNPSDSS